MTIGTESAAAKQDFEYQLSQLLQEYRDEVPSHQLAASLNRYAELAVVRTHYDHPGDER